MLPEGWIDIASVIVCVALICRNDLQKQADLAPERYRDHSTAYLAGKPPTASHTLLGGGSVPTADQQDND